MYSVVFITFIVQSSEFNAGDLAVILVLFLGQWVVLWAVGQDKKQLSYLIHFCHLVGYSCLFFEMTLKPTM